MKNLLLLSTLTALTFSSLRAENWPAWRGAKGDGISQEKNLPVEWSTNKNVRWRVELPEPGNSTPIVWQDRIFLTQPLKSEKQRALFCFDARTGKKLWQSGVVVTANERTHDTNPYGSASPVTDGQKVISWFGSGGVAAYDLEGKELWRTDLGEHSHRFGYGGSPVMVGDVVILNFGPGNREFLVALDKATGKERWRHTSKTPSAEDIHGTWSTPFIVDWKGQTQVISALRGELAALNPSNGEVIWHTTGHGIQAKTSPIVGEGIVISSGDMQSSEVAVRLGGSGDITDTHTLWKKNPPKRRIGTGVIHNGRYYGIQTAGIADCLKLETGEMVWEERLTGSGANNAVWSSPILADGKLYIMNQNGDVFVLRASENFELVALNSLKEQSNSSVVPSGGHLFLRTHKALWCIGTTDKDTQARAN